MEDWFLALQKPWWYPGNDAWTMLNRWGLVFYTLVSVVYVIGFYHIVRRKWSLYIGVLFVLNVISNFAVYPLMAEGDPAGLLRGVIAMTVALISILCIEIWMYSRSKILFGLLLPYTIWAIPITALTWELWLLNG
ncbi:MAG: hypothetical protein BRC23_02245 [Parcubacteria group bacterium SW_4_49_11]|nr:MAG: hypothetical protein BRC23_02245 [Parcubacteria group bacterium SW_4_49_11]